MSSTLIAVIVIVAVIIVAIVAVGGWLLGRRRALRSQFGPEYERLVAEQNNRLSAERELRDRQRRHARLRLRPLSPASRARYTGAWEAIQAQFVDSPGDAVNAADALVTEAAGEIGYPTGDYDEQIAQLSVDHASTLGHLRDAHDIYLTNQRGQASTEQLRQALVHYRALFTELLEEPAADTEPATGRQPAAEPEPAAALEPAADTEPATEPEPAADLGPAAGPGADTEAVRAGRPIDGAEPVAAAEPVDRAEPIDGAEVVDGAEPVTEPTNADRLDGPGRHAAQPARRA